MTQTAVVLYFLVVLVYLAATVHYAVEFVRGMERIELWDRVERTMTFVLHGLFLLALGFAYGELPLVRFEFLSFLALGVAVVHTILEGRYRTRGTGVFFFALAFVLHAASWPGVLHRPPTSPLLQNPVFGVHVLAALLGYVGFLISALYGVFFLIVYRSLKSRRQGLFVERMPPLDLLSKMNITAATVGFVFLTAALGFGTVLSVRLDVPFLRDPKFIQSIVVWVLYGLLILGRYAMGWRGRMLVGISLGCFAVAVLSIWLVGAYLPTFHNFS